MLIVLIADAFFKAAISLIPDVPRMLKIDHKMRSTEPLLQAYISNFLSTLLVVPVSTCTLKNFVFKMIALLLIIYMLHSQIPPNQLRRPHLT